MNSFSNSSWREILKKSGRIDLEMKHLTLLLPLFACFSLNAVWNIGFGDSGGINLALLCDVDLVRDILNLHPGTSLVISFVFVFAEQMRADRRVLSLRLILWSSWKILRILFGAQLNSMSSTCPSGSF